MPDLLCCHRQTCATSMSCMAGQFQRVRTACSTVGVHFCCRLQLCIKGAAYPSCPNVLLVRGAMLLAEIPPFVTLLLNSTSEPAEQVLLQQNAWSTSAFKTRYEIVMRRPIFIWKASLFYNVEPQAVQQKICSRLWSQMQSSKQINRKHVSRATIG